MINASRSLFARIAIAVSLTALLSSAAIAADSGFQFKVHNTTRSTIVKILVSEDGRSWGEFDLGSGIPAGSSDTLVWDESTNNERCDEYIKAVFADGVETDVAKFNFCEANLEIEF